MKRKMTAVYRFNQNEKSSAQSRLKRSLFSIKEVEEGAHCSPGTASHLKSHTVLTDPKIKNTTKLDSIKWPLLLYRITSHCSPGLSWNTCFLPCQSVDGSQIDRRQGSCAWTRSCRWNTRGTLETACDQDSVQSIKKIYGTNLAFIIASIHSTHCSRELHSNRYFLSASSRKAEDRTLKNA